MKLLQLAVLAALLSPVVEAQAPRNRRLSDPMAFGTLPMAAFTPLHSPDGTRLAFSVNSLDTGAFLLAATPVDLAGGAELLSTYGGPNVRSAAWSLDSADLIYTAGPSFIAGNELFVVAADGSSAPVRLVPFGAGLPGSGLTRFEPTADGLRVVYSQLLSLSSVLLDGSAPPVALPGASSVVAFATTPSGRVVHYDGTHFRSVPADGSGPSVQLTLVPSPGASFRLAAGGARVVYSTSLAGVVHLHSVPVDGSAAPLVLTAGLPAFASVESFLVSPDGATLVYRADGLVDERMELFRVPVDGSAAPVLLAGVSAGGQVFTGYQFSPDGAQVVYEANTGAPLAAELARVALDGSSANTLFAGDVRAFEVTADSNHVVFSTATAFATDQLQRVPMSGGASVVLTPAFTSGGALSEFHATSNGAGVVYRADALIDGVEELFFVPSEPAAPPAAVRLNVPLGPGQAVTNFLLAADGSHAAFLASHVDPDLSRVFRAELSGPPTPTDYGNPLPGDVLGDVLDFRIGGGRGLYLADQEVDQQFELFAVPLDGSASPQALSGTLAPGAAVLSFEILPGGSHAAYLADANLDGQFEAFVVPADGSAAPLALHGPLVAGTDVLRTPLPTPDGSRWILGATLAASPSLRLYSVPATGGALTQLGTWSGAGPLLVTPDSSRVLYTSPSGSLMSQPVTGGAASNLSGALIGLLEVAVTPDSSATVFRATTSGFGPRLFSAPTGGGPRVTLSPALVAGGSVTSFQLAPDGSRALFIADAVTDEHHLLYTVPVDGSAAAVVVHDATYEVETFQTAGARVAMRLTRVVFFSTAWSVATSALDGSDDQVLLEVASPPGYVLTPNGTTVLVTFAGEIRSHPAAGGASRLIYTGPGVPAGFSPSGNLVRLFDDGYRVMSIHGGDTQLMLENGVLPSTGLGKTFQWRTDRLWFYRGSRDVPGVIEFYSGRLERYRLR